MYFYCLSRNCWRLSIYSCSKNRIRVTESGSCWKYNPKIVISVYCCSKSDVESELHLRIDDHGSRGSDGNVREKGGCEIAGIDSASVDLVRSLVGGDGNKVGGLV